MHLLKTTTVKQVKYCLKIIFVSTYFTYVHSFSFKAFTFFRTTMIDTFPRVFIQLKKNKENYSCESNSEIELY